MSHLHKNVYIHKYAFFDALNFILPRYFPDYHVEHGVQVDKSTLQLMKGNSLFLIIIMFYNYYVLLIFISKAPRSKTLQTYGRMGNRKL